ncbi:MAG: type VI secretion system ATPase TssH [Tolumonas sp.]|nr:type VI secretion system ATPase TssH [Tolumonas sp.]
MITIKLDELIQTLDLEEKQALEIAANHCVARAGCEILVEDYLLALLDKPTSFLNQALLQFSLNAETLRTALLTSVSCQVTESRNPVFSVLLVSWLEEALLVAKLQLQAPTISSLALLLAILDHPEKYGRTCYGQFFSDIPRDRLMALMDGLLATAKSQQPAAHEQTVLQQFTKNYTQQARDGQLDPVLCRDEEIRQTIDILSRRRKNNPILVGEAGVGKTAVVEGLAQQIVAGLVPPALADIELLELDMGLLQAGASVKGEFERRLKAVIDAVQASVKPIVLFIDEAHTLIGAGGQAGGSDAANLLKPALARGALRTLAATTWSEYKKYFEKDPALARRFQPIQVLEPTVVQATTILRGLVSRYESTHAVYLRDDAVVAAATLSARYLSGRQLPDKAIDLLDTACARVKNSQHAMPIGLQILATQLAEQQRQLTALLRDQQHGLPVDNQLISELETQIPVLEQEEASLTAHWQQQAVLVAQLMASRSQTDHNASSEATSAALLAHQQMHGVLIHHEVTPHVVADVIASWTGIPLANLIETPSTQVTEFAARLQGRIRGQDQAIALIERAVKATAAGLGNPQAPTGVFLLAGPSGVGKTETALAVAELLYGGERFLTTINMSEFQEKHALSRLIGAPPGYVGYGEGGVLTEAVRQRPYSVILLDEVEKADPDIMNLFYQVFDKGVANDGEGRAINFRNTLIFMTTNLAATQINQLAATEPVCSTEAITEAIRPLLAKHFKPALLARMSIIPYLPIDSAIMRELVEVRLQQLTQRIAPRGIALTFDAAVISAIAENCTRVDSGARNIDFLVNNYLLPAIADRILLALTQQETLQSIHVTQDAQGNFELNIG